VSPPVIAIVGPTAVGKSALALALAERLGGEIVNADALQVYRGLDIGTAKPSPAERRRVPHHLIDILEPAERYSAGRFAALAETAIAGIQARRAVPILVGGSGLYLRALLEGIAPMPPVDPAVRDELLGRLERDGLAALHRELALRDPPTAARLGAGDRQRVLRALEVVVSSGQPLSSWIARRPFGARRLAATRIGLTLSRRVLYDRIAVRVCRMREEGLEEEVRRLLESGVHPEAPAFQAIGYRQFAQVARGLWTAEQAVTETIRATRRFAKRQQTWFRGERDIVWFDAAVPASLADEVLSHLRRAGFGRER
jgi:tRNA dimethylallyltransferase